MRVLCALVALTALASEVGAQSSDNPVCDSDSSGLWKRDTRFLRVWWNDARPVDIAECLEAGAEPDATGILRHAAEWTRYPAVVQMLLDAGADPDPIDGVESPLYWAARRTDNVTVVYGVIAALLFAGADIGPDKSGYTPLNHVLTYQPNSVALVELLLEAGSDPNGSWGATSPLQQAATSTTNPQILETLLVAGADPNPGPGGVNAMWMVVKRCKPNLVRPLLEHGADPRAGDDDFGVIRLAADDCARSDREAIMRLLGRVGSA